MPSFLSKVFGRKKADDHQSPTNDGNNNNAQSPINKRASPSLLEGKFEAVSPTVSPSVTHFANNALPLQRNEKEQDGAFTGLFRPKSRTVLSTPPQIPRKSLELPHLTLNFSLPKTGAAEELSLGSVFGADPDEGVLLAEDVIGARRLSPQEALILIRSCSQAIINHGLGSLGIMHPHWYSTSPDLQRKLISLFIRSLDPSVAPSTSLPPTISSSPSPASAFATEIESVRSPHDVAAVLRWGIRHLRLDGTAFGTDTDWYRAFTSAERRASYPARAFSDILVPLLPSAHTDLLKATLQIISSLASHAEANGISGSKLTKFVGLWLLTINRSEPADDWDAFYARWERNGRILEHLFLAEIRDEDQMQKLPRRLTELVAGYPHGAGEDDNDDLLPRPRLSTRRYPALYVLVETTVPKSTPLDVKSHPIRLLTDALGAAPASSAVEPNPTWDAVKSESIATITDLESESDNQEKQIVLSRVFDDETIRLLSLLPSPPSFSQPTGSRNGSPALAVLSPPSLPPLHRSPASKPGSGEATPLASSSPASHSRVLRTPPPLPPPSTFPSNSVYTNTTDWAQFSTSGFGESPATLASTLLDKDLEVTEPQVQRRRSSRKRKGKDQSRSRRASVEAASRQRQQQQRQQQRKEEEVERTSKAVRVENVELDEAFVDFWADALLDPISSGFPAVVVCKLKGAGAGVTSPVVASSPTVGPSSPSLLSSTAPTAAAADTANDNNSNNNNNNNNASVDWLIVEQKLVHPSPPAPAPAPPASPSPPLSSSPVPAAPSPTPEEPASKRPRMRTGFGSGSSSSPSSPTVSSTAKKRFSFFGGSSSSTSSNGGGISFVDKAKSVAAGRRSSAAAGTTGASASKMGRAASSSAALGGGGSAGGFKVGEMGEVIYEEPTSMTKTKATDEEVKTATTTTMATATMAAGAGLVGLGVGAVAAAAAASAAAAATQDKDKEVEKAVAQPLPESPVGELPLAVLDETEEEEDKGKDKEPETAAKEEGKEEVVSSPPLASSSSEADIPAAPVSTTTQETSSEVVAPAAQDTNESEAVVAPPAVPAEATLSTDTLVPTPQPQEQALPITTTTTTITDAPAPEPEGAEVEETVVGDVTDIGSAAQHADEGVPTAFSAEDADVPVVAEKSIESVKEETEGAEETLPPAPESVVLAGETPGPQLALDTTEEESTSAAVDIVPEAPQEQADNSKAEEAEAAVDLPEVPIVDVEVPVPESNHQETLLDEAEVVPVANTEETASPEVEVDEPRVEETVEDPVVEEPATEEAIVEEPAVEEPTVEEPVVEEPIVEEPALEESVIEEPAVEEPAVEEPVVQEVIVEEPIVEEPAAEKPVFEEPAIEEPTVEEPTTEEFAAISEEPVAEPTADSEEPAAQEPVIQEPSAEEPAVEEAAPEELPAAQEPVVEMTPVEVPSVFAEPVVEEEPTDAHEHVKEESIAEQPAVEKHKDENAEASAPSTAVEETETGAEDTTEPSA